MNATKEPIRVIRSALGSTKEPIRVIRSALGSFVKKQASRIDQVTYRIVNGEGDELVLEEVAEVPQNNGFSFVTVWLLVLAVYLGVMLAMAYMNNIANKIVHSEHDKAALVTEATAMDSEEAARLLALAHELVVPQPHARKKTIPKGGRIGDSDSEEEGISPKGFCFC